MWKFVAYLMEPRTALYKLAATLFSFPPSGETLASLQKQLSKYPEQLEFWDDSILAASTKSLIRALEQSRAEADVRSDHSRLFTGTGTDEKYASESAFRDPLRSGLIAQDVSSTYASFGFHKAGWFSGPDDHVAMECLFMSLMGRNFVTMAQEMVVNPSAYISHLERQHGFVSEHMIQWIPSWERQVRRCGITRLYRTAAELTRTLVETDQKKLIDYVKLIQGCGYNNYHKDRLKRIQRQGKCSTDSRRS